MQERQRFSIRISGEKKFSSSSGALAAPPAYLRTSNPISVRVSIQKTINRPRNTECQCSHWLTEQRGEKAQNWHCQLLELSKLAVPRTDLFSGLNLYTGQ